MLSRGGVQRLHHQVVSVGVRQFCRRLLQHLPDLATECVFLRSEPALRAPQNRCASFEDLRVVCVSTGFIFVEMLVYQHIDIMVYYSIRHKSCICFAVRYLRQNSDGAVEKIAICV